MNSTTNGLAGLTLAAGSRLAILAGGATNAIFNGNTMYVAGQQLLSDGLFSGQLSIVNITTSTLQGQYGISDGTHNKMLFADDNTLWIGSVTCEGGERYKQVQTGRRQRAVWLPDDVQHLDELRDHDRRLQG